MLSNHDLLFIVLYEWILLSIVVHDCPLHHFVDLKALLYNRRGTYLLNLSVTDPEMIGIFGEQNLITEHHRPTMVYDLEKENRWDCGYWWDFKSSKRS